MQRLRRLHGLVVIRLIDLTSAGRGLVRGSPAARGGSPAHPQSLIDPSGRPLRSGSSDAAVASSDLGAGAAATGAAPMGLGSGPVSGRVPPPAQSGAGG
ncbi:hypothetical protein C5C42_08740 [Rathayibacter sp. AY1F7]|nr:hypothetical protein C5C54_11100 [Rathayibacter sp. AY1F2]PPH45621.1 hypothetical protein C5C42_08740 [Rathayibacter sp. AY1F7]